MINTLKKVINSPLLIVFILAIPTFSALLRPGYFPMHDDIQAMRLLEMDKCIKDGQIPCRWVPDMGFGYGYPQFNYYAPLPYYIMEIFHLGGLGILDSVKAGFVVSVVGSLVGMYLLGVSLWGKFGGVVSSLFYAYAPYRAVDMYVRGAVGELYAFIFLPIVFWATRKALRGNKKSVLWLALSLAALITSHNITSLIILPFLFGWVVFVVFNEGISLLPDLKKRIIKLASGFIWGIGLSAFFLLPAWFEKNLVHIETLKGGYFNFLAHFVSLKQLLFSSNWGYGTSQAGSFDEISLALGIFHWTLPLVAILVAYILGKRIKLNSILFWAASGWVSAFMTHARSVFIWKALPITSFIQFPWRFLLPASFFFSIAAGAVGLFFQKRSSWRFIAAVFFVLVLSYASFFKPVSWLDINETQKFSGESWQRQQTVSIYDYLPIYAKKAPSKVAPEAPQVLTGQAEVKNWQKGTNWAKGRILVKEEAEILIPIYYFPDWKVRSNGSELVIRHDNEFGLINFNLPAGQYEIEARLMSTPVRKGGNAITILGLVLIPLYLVKERKK